MPGKPHASWCLATEDDDEDAESANGYSVASGPNQTEDREATS